MAQNARPQEAAAPTDQAEQRPDSPLRRSFDSAQRSGAPFIDSAQRSAAPFADSAKRSAAPSIDGPALATRSDEALCALALTSQALATAAWDTLIQRHNHRVVVSLLARGVPLERARELAQDTWARLIEQQRRGALPSLKLPGLAITQATFLALEEGRREGARGARSLDLAQVAERLADPEAGAEERLLSREQLARAEEALSRCSGSAQRVFRLLYENPTLSHAEAAQQVGLSLQRVRQILCEVRKRVRSALEDVA